MKEIVSEKTLFARSRHFALLTLKLGLLKEKKFRSLELSLNRGLTVFRYNDILKHLPFYGNQNQIVHTRAWK